MFVYKNGLFYDGDLALGDREATESEIAVFNAAREKQAKLTEIASLLAQAGVTESSAWQLEAWLGQMSLTAGQQGITEPQLYAANPGYRQIKDQFLLIAQKRAQL